MRGHIRQRGKTWGYLVDVGERRLSVRQALTMVGNVPTFGQTKTNAGARSLALDATTVAALRTHRARQAEERLSWGPAYRSSGLVFTREDGNLIPPGWVYKRFIRLSEAVRPPPHPTS